LSLERDGCALAASLAHGSLRCLSIRCIVDRHARPVRRQRQRDRAADTPRAAGHKRYFLPEIEEAIHLPRAGSLLIFLTSTPGAIRLIRPVRTRPGPISTNFVTPCSTMYSTHCTQRTGCVSWKTNSSPISLAFATGCARSLVTIGIRGSRSELVEIASRIASAAGAINEV